ncbi:carotenoid oxygenase family protein [Streptosporangium carneum]|uniref:Dioxygenase n=1 Tax=Streptosporangium carneum TaxID=47481 RepID=A0A9W6MF56_9ACTN|nr:carotenoid oxygenase family protein [Streptosporangium carneum]GLK12294.1 dioxygenase [Streptosporangium carneum]
MAAPARASHPAPATAFPVADRPSSQERLPVEGVLPADLDGCFLQAFPHPAEAGRPGGGFVLSGIRLGGGEATRHRARTTARHETPLGPLPALAPPIRLARTVTGAPRTPGHVTLARPVRDPSTREWHTVASYPGLGHAEHLTAGPDGVVSRAQPFTLDGAPLMHAVALTGRHVVVFDLPVVYRHAAALVGARLPYAWRPDRPARVGLLPREGTAEPRWFPVDPCYVFHAVNAYEEEGRVIVDAVRRPRAFDATPDASDVAPDAASAAQERPDLWRWTFDLATGAVHERALAPGWETALADERVCGRAHRHVFGSREGAAGPELVRHDLVTGGVQAYELGRGLRAGRPVFVPRHGGQHGDAEGDGWILVFAHDDAHRRGELLVFDALDLPGGPYAAVRVPDASPEAYRAVWLPA